MSRNDSTCHHAKDYIGKPHALYFGYGPVVESVIIAVLPKPASTSTPSSPDDQRTPRSRDLLKTLVFNQYGTWTALLVFPSGFRSKLRMNNRDSTKGCPTPSKLRAALQKDRPDLSLATIARIPEKPFPTFSNRLLGYEDRTLPKGYKFGLVYCRGGQTQEEEMLRNLHEDASPAYLGFLQWLGPLILLKDRSSYVGGLDILRNTSGTHTIQGTIQNPSLSENTWDDTRLEMIFHVATMMPFVPTDPQAIERKRHIGNDIVTLVFQDRDAPPFCPTSITTNFTHVYVVVRELAPESYHVGVVSKNHVPPFGPPLPSAQYFQRDKEEVSMIRLGLG